MMPKVTSLLARRMTTKERILLYATPNSMNQCWEWSGYRDRDGYGKISISGHPEMAHRASWVAYFGEIPDGAILCHRCDNPPCVNPGHLFIGSHQDNSDDMRNKGRNKHLFGSSHGSAKLTDKQVLEIYARYRRGEIGRNLAMEYQVSPMTISNIANRKRWRHLTEEAA